MMDLLRHFFSRGHDGRVTCVDASAAADFVVSGGVDYTVRTGPILAFGPTVELFGFGPLAPVAKSELMLFDS